MVAGIVLAVLGIELMPRALEAGPAWAMCLAFVAGGLFFLAVGSLIERLQGRNSGQSQSAAAWLIYFGVAVDLFSDGIMIGIGSTVAFELGLLLALAQVPADIPEGFATIATFRRKGIARYRRLMPTGLLAVPIFLGATLGYWVLLGRPVVYRMATLAFTAGLLLSVVVEEMIREAHRGEESRWDVLGLVGGFSLFALLTSYFG